MKLPWHHKKEPVKPFLPYAPPPVALHDLVDATSVNQARLEGLRMEFKLAQGRGDDATRPSRPV